MILMNEEYISTIWFLPGYLQSHPQPIARYARFIHTPTPMMAGCVRLSSCGMTEEGTTQPVRYITPDGASYNRYAHV